MSELAYENCYGVINNHIIGKSTVDNRNLALVYDPDSVYNKGSHCIHGMKYWVCNTDNTTGTWNASKWTQTRVGDETKLKVIASVNGNGTKTMKQLLNELYALVANKDLSLEAKLVYTTYIYSITNKASSSLSFCLLSAASSFGTMDEIVLASNSASIYRRWIFRTTGNEFDNTVYSDGVVPSGRSFTIYDR